MKNHKYLILFSYVLLLTIFGIVFLDFAGVFNYSDDPFFIAFFLYALFIFIQKGTSRLSFIITIYFLTLMGLSYVPTGPGRVTERIGEWFYLFFVCGLIHNAEEAWRG